MQAPKQIQGSWQIIPPEVRINILRFLPNDALQAIATTARAENELAHSRECHRMRRATLRAIRIDWSVTGPTLFRHNLAFFSTFPHLSAESHLKLLQWDASDFAESLDPEVTGTSEPQLRPCIRDRWLTQEEGQKLLVELIEAEDLETVKLLLASGIRPTPTALQKAIEVSEEYAEALLHAGARPSIDDLTTALETRDDDEGELFVLLLRWAPSSADDLLSELGDNPDETIGCLPATGGVRPTYWDCIEKTGTLLEELDHLLETAQSGALDPKCLYPHICEASPLTPCLRKVLDSPLPDPAVCQLLESLIARRAKVTQEILEAALRRRSEACLKVLFEKSDVVPTTWMLERAIVIEKQHPQLLQALITRGAKPSQLALDLAIEHVPSLVPALLKELDAPWKRALIKAAYFLKKWPDWKIQSADQLPILNLVCLWQPGNTELLGQLLQNMTLTAPKLSPLFFRALRRHHADTLQTLLKHCPDLADQAITKAIGTSTGSVTALVKSGASIQRSHLVQALKQKPISEEMVLYLLEQERPIDEDLFTLAAKYGTPAIIRRFRERGGLVTPHILEKAFRRSPFDPTVIEALRDNKLEPHMRRLVAFPIQQLLLKPATEVSPRDIKDLFILFSTPTRTPHTFSRNKGKERMRKAPSVSSVSPQDPPDLLIDCFLKLATQWPQQKVRAVLSGIASRRLVVERASSSPDLALIEKLMASDLSAKPTVTGVLIKHGESQTLKLLLKARQSPPLYLVIELLRSPKGRSDPILSSALAALTPKQHEQLYLHIIREISLTKPGTSDTRLEWKRLFTDDWCQAFEVLVKQKIKPSERVLLAAASIPVLKTINLLETLLLVWVGSIPPQVVIRAAETLEPRDRSRPAKINALHARYTASRGDPGQLLIAAVESEWPPARVLEYLLRKGLRPSDSVLAHAIKSRSRQAPEYVRALLPMDTTLKEEWLLALAQCRSPRAEEVTLQILLHPSAPKKLPKAWITHLIDNPSPKAEEIFDWARKLTTIQGLNADALCRAVQSPHPSSLAIAELLISYVRPLPGELLELAASNVQHGPKLVANLLEMGFPVTETALWNARVNRRTHRLLHRVHENQLLKGKQRVISAPPPVDVKINVEEFNLGDYLWLTDTQLIRLARRWPKLRRVFTVVGFFRTHEQPQGVDRCTSRGLATFLEHCPELEELDLQGRHNSCQRYHRLQGCGLSQVASCLPKLRRVSVRNTTISGRALLTFLEYCPELRELALVNHPFLDDTYLSRMAKRLPKIRKISLLGSRKESRSLSTLMYCPGRGVAKTARFRQLEELSALVRHFPKLRELDFHHFNEPAISLENAAVLAKCQHLETLRLVLDINQVKRVAIAWPERLFAKLRHLELEVTHGDDPEYWVAELLSHCPNLEIISLANDHIYNCSIAFDTVFQELAKNCPNLTTIRLGRKPHPEQPITPSSIEALAKRTQLKHVEWRFGGAEMFETITTNCPHVQTLSWPHADLNDLHIQTLAQSCQGLRKLTVSDGKNITKKGWEALQNCAQLRNLQIHELKSSESLTAIAAACTQLQNLTLAKYSEACLVRREAVDRFSDSVVLNREDLTAICQGDQFRAERIFKAARRTVGRIHSDIGWEEVLRALPHDDSRRIQEFWDNMRRRHATEHLRWLDQMIEQEVLNVDKMGTFEQPGLLDQIIEVVGTLDEAEITAFLRVFSDLTVLKLGSLSLSKWIGPLSQVRPPVRELELSCRHLPQGAIMPLAKALPGIRRLRVTARLTDGWITTDAWIIALSRAFPELTHVKLPDNDQLTFRGIRALAENCPHLQQASFHEIIQPHNYPDARSAVRSGVQQLFSNNSRRGSWLLRKCGNEIEPQYLNEFFAEFFKENHRNNREVISVFWSCMKTLIEEGMIPDWVPSSKVLEVSKQFCEGKSARNYYSYQPKLIFRIASCMMNLSDNAVEAFTRTFSDVDTVQWLYYKNQGAAILIEKRLSALLQGLPKLSTLIVDNRVALSDVGCQAIAVHGKELKTLQLCGDSLTPEGIGSIAKGCSKLQKLKLRTADDAHLAALAPCSHLQELTIQCSVSLSIQGLRKILRSCRTLKRLNLKSSNHFEQSDLQKLKKQHPNVWLSQY